MLGSTYDRDKLLEVESINKKVNYINKEVDNKEVNNKFCDNVSLEDISKRNVSEFSNEIRNARVCILGAGGLGSNIANMLARSCISHIRVVDFDVVEASNLNRQLYFTEHIGMYKVEALKEMLSRVNPFVDVEALVIKVDEKNILDLVKDYDIVVEAFDMAEMKALVVNYILENFKDKYVVSGSGMAGIKESNTVTTKRVMDRLIICGDYVSDFEKVDGIMAPRVMLVASHQANAVLRLICGLDE